MAGRKIRLGFTNKTSEVGNMKKIVLDYKGIEGFVSKEDIEAIKENVIAAKDKLVDRTCAGKEFTGWIDLPVNYDKKEFARIKETAGRIQKMCDALVVIGIGGSYLGAKAAVEFLNHCFYNCSSKDKRRGPQIYFLGNSISEVYLSNLLEMLEDKDICVNVISKSGTTLEPAIAFRVMREFMEKKYGEEEAAKRIFATTDKEKGALKELATERGYETFVVPDDIGGRYSVLTAVGLLPIAVTGVDIDKLMSGAASMRERCLSGDYYDNDALLYAAIRNILYNNGKAIEILCNYEPYVNYICEWWKQLFAESEGKEGKGLFTASLNLTTDLHSMGQFIQSGPRIMFETVISVGNAGAGIVMKKQDDDADGLNYLDGKSVEYINSKALEGTMKAHIDAGVPNLLIKISDRDEEALGELFYFMMFACGVSGLVLDVNPFDQPGVEYYKRNIFKLLERPGY